MTRIADALPISARIAGYDLVRKAKRDAQDVEQQQCLVSRDRRQVTSESIDAQIEQTRAIDGAWKAWQLETLHYGLDAGEIAAIAYRHDARVTMLRETYEGACTDREKRILAFRAEETRLGLLFAETLRQTQALEAARASSAGLAPWDAVALTARRAWGDEMPSATSEGPPMLKGADVAILFKTRLGVSRATYYSRYRCLLLSYHVTPVRVEYLANGGAAVHRGATLRFRREEVESLLQYLVSEADLAW